MTLTGKEPEIGFYLEPGSIFDAMSYFYNLSNIFEFLAFFLRVAPAQSQQVGDSTRARLGA